MTPKVGACETAFGSSVVTAIEIDVTSTTKVLERTFMFATLFYIIHLINNKKQNLDDVSVNRSKQ